jgi:DNA-directed RNA polymerase delta subunit
MINQLSGLIQAHRLLQLINQLIAVTLGCESVNLQDDAHSLHFPVSRTDNRFITFLDFRYACRSWYSSSNIDDFCWYSNKSYHQNFHNVIKLYR